MLTIERALELLDNVKKVGPGKWAACCPVHRDTHPFLSIQRGDKVAMLLRCYACSARFEDILRALEARDAGVRR